jgi:hypothetical protein
MRHMRSSHSCILCCIARWVGRCALLAELQRPRRWVDSVATARAQGANDTREAKVLSHPFEFPRNDSKHDDRHGDYVRIIAEDSNTVAGLN